jgi:hypothetical protein
LPRNAWLAFIVFGSSVLGCGGDSSDATQPDAAPNGAPLYGACANSDLDCASGNCAAYVGLNACTNGCSQDADCVGANSEKGQCREVPVSYGEAEKLCVRPCDADLKWKWQCKDGEYLFCDIADSGASCKVCDCAEGSVCDADSGACLPLVKGSGACRTDAECTSGKCTNEFCTSGPGDACSDSCDGLCNGSGDSSAYCAPRCTDTYFCAGLPGWDCILLHEQDSSDRYCTPQCDSNNDCPVPGDECVPYDRTVGSPEPSQKGFCWQAL